MADTTFVDNTTPTVNAAWLNEINDHVHNDSPISPATTVHGSDVIEYTPTDSGAIATTVETQLSKVRYATNYSLSDFFTGASDNYNFLPGGTYTLTSLLDLSANPLSNCTFQGVPGKTKITGSFGYALILLGALSNVNFIDIIFETTYTNATLSANTAVVYQGASDCIDVHFTRCKFTAPNANTQGLVFFNRTQAGGSETCVIDGLWIEDCDFEEIGQTGCTIMNRQTTSDKYLAARHIYFNRNRGKNLGLNTDFGFLVSFDGYGSSFECDSNEIKNPYINGIENTQWINGSISYNMFSDFQRKSRAIAVSNGTVVVTGLTVIGNKCLEPASFFSVANFLEDSYFAGNVWDFDDDLTLVATADEQAFRFADCNNNVVNGDQYISTGAYALRFTHTTGTCTGNRLRDIVADNSASAANTATVNFDGASTTNNIVEGRFAKGTGGSLWTQTTTAATNTIGADKIGAFTPSVTFATPGDVSLASVSAAGTYSREGNRVTTSFEYQAVITHTTASGALRITGFPYAALGATPLDYGALGGFQGITKASYTQFILRSTNTQTYMNVVASGSGQTAAAISTGDIPTGGTLILNGTITYLISE